MLPENNRIQEKLSLLQHPLLSMEETRPYMQLMMQYDCAMLEVRTKLEVLNSELSLESEHNPFESIKCRLKKPQSILEKLQRRNLPISVDSIEKNLTDVAGIRVICSFPEDIYRMAECLCAQDDIIVCEVKDYIKNPKPNGYRSLHLILDVPIFLTNEKKHMKVEVQFRTIAMDFWASLEHKVRYKKDIKHSAMIAADLKLCAETINAMDHEMQRIRHLIEENSGEASKDPAPKP
ncbi:GTP pyrophosphokinase [Acidaminobacterium chupaoyuni]